MKRDLAVALLVLCLSHIVLVKSEVSQANSTSSAKGRLTQHGDGYEGPDPYEEGPYQADPGYQDHECPLEQPADDVKEVYMGHGTVVWRVLAAKAEEQQRAANRLKQPAPMLERGVAQAPAASTPAGGGTSEPSEPTNKDPAPAGINTSTTTTQTNTTESKAPAPSSTTAPAAAAPVTSPQQQPSAVQAQPADSKSPEATKQAPADPSKPATTPVQKQQQPTTSPQANSTGSSPQKATVQAPAGSATPTSAGGSVQAGTTAVTNDAFLLPTSLDQLDKGYPGTFDPTHFPSSEALAVGPHPTEEDLIFVLHAINAQAEVLPADKDGVPVENVTPTKVPLYDLAASTGIDMTNLKVSRVAALFDADRKRYILVWTTYAEGDVAVTPPLFVAASLSSNPLAAWMVWALDLRPDVAVGVQFCADQELSAFYLSELQVSYSKDGLFIGVTPQCKINGGDTTQHLSALYVLSKDALCDPVNVAEPDRDGYLEAKLYAAIYFASRSWYRSVVATELEMVPDAYEPFNSHILPARPQHVSDLEDAPMFVMKVSAGQMSIATLSGAPLKEMCSVDTAPLIKAVVAGKGGDFSNTRGSSDGNPYMPQPQTNIKLTVDGVGMPTAYGGVTSWATLHKGLLYVTTSEYWGANQLRVPSIFWAIFKPSADICHLTREDEGFVASQDGLSLAYPVIAGKGKGAVVAYSYSGAGKMANDMYQAYPGVALTYVGAGSDGSSGIDVVKRGPGSLVITDPAVNQGNVLPWGYNSAAHVCGDEMWFAVPIPAVVENDYKAPLWYGSWISYTPV